MDYRRAFYSSFVLLVTVCFQAHRSESAVTHRWSFDSDTSDSVGSLTWASNGGATVSGGSVVFDGVDDFLELATSPLPSSGSASIEVWGTYDPSSPTGSRIFDFASANGDLYQYLTPNSLDSGTGAIDTAAGWDDDFNAEIGPRGGGPSNTGEQVLLTLVYDESATPDTLGPGEFRLYRNGLLIGAIGSEGLNILGFSGTGTTTVNRLGHGISNTTASNSVELDNPPQFLNGSINEFRTWNNALTEAEITINAIAGPDTLAPTFVTTTWTAGAGDWNQGSNWTGGSAPGLASHAILDNGGSPSVTSAVQQAGRLGISSGSVGISGNGTLDVAYPIELTPGAVNTAEINVSGGGQLIVSQVTGDEEAGIKSINIDGGTLSSSFAGGSVGATVGVDVGAGGATLSSPAGNRLVIQGALTGTGPITIEGAGKAGFVGGAENTYSGEVTVNNSTLDMVNLDGVHGGFTSLNAASRVVLNNSKLDSNPSGGGGNVFAAPLHLPEGTENTLTHRGVNRSGEREPFMQGSFTGGGTLHYTTTRTVPIGWDFGGETADNSAFSGKLVVDDVSGNAEGMLIAVRIRSEGSDFPNAVFEINSPGSFLGKRGTDANQIIQLGGVSGVAGAWLQPSIAGGSDPLADVTFELGGAAEDAEFFGHIQDASAGADVATVVKVGDNTQALSGANTYSGTTTVNAGTLLINGTHMMADNPVGDYTVNAGGTLGGTGTIGSPADNVNVNVLGGSLAPGGASPGTLTINGNFSQDASSTLAIEIGGNPASGLFDLLDVSGSASLAGMLDVSLFGSPSLSVGDAFTVLTAASVSGGGGLSLTGSASDAFSLDATSGNSLVLTFLGGGVVDVDLDNDGDVDGIDFLLIQRTNPSLISDWQAQYGSSSSIAAATSVPEPLSIVVLATGTLLGLAVGRRGNTGLRS